MRLGYVRNIALAISASCQLMVQELAPTGQNWRHVGITRRAFCNGGVNHLLTQSIEIIDSLLCDRQVLFRGIKRGHQIPEVRFLIDRYISSHRFARAEFR